MQQAQSDGRRFGAMLCEAIGLDPAKVAWIHVTVAADDVVRFEVGGTVRYSGLLMPSAEFLQDAIAKGLRVIVDTDAPTASVRYSLAEDVPTLDKDRADDAL